MPLESQSSPTLLQRLSAVSDRWQVAIAALLLAVVLLPGLGRSGLLDPWEMDRAAVARQMAAAPRVLVAEGGDGSLAAALEKAAGSRYAVVRTANKADARAGVAVQAAVQRLGHEVAHAVVVDLDAAHQRGRSWDDVAVPLATIESQNPGMALLLVSASDGQEALQATARARARQWAASARGVATAGWLAADDDGEPLWPLFASRAEVVRADALVAALDRSCPSPWSLPGHKRDGEMVAVPWLEAAVAASGFALAGNTETGARLGGALTVLLTGLLTVLAVRRLWGIRTAWLALLVYATLPSAVGIARLLTMEATPLLGMALVALGLAQGAAAGQSLDDSAPAAAQQRPSRLWWLWFLAGCVVLLLGRGLAGATMASAVAVAYLLATADLRWSTAAVACLSVAALAAAATVVLGDGGDAVLLRGLRFTQSTFSAGPDSFHRDFAWFVGQAGFGLFPWGAAVAIGLGLLLTGTHVAVEDANRLRASRVGAALLLGLVVPFAVVAVLVRQYNHLVVPVAAVATVAAAVALDALLRGQLRGRLVAAFVILSTLLLHREIGKGADTLTRFFAFDPPLAPAGGTGPLVWPSELAMSRPLRAVALLAVVAFALGLARPFATVQRAVEALRRPRLAAWTLGALAMAWALDALISLGTKLDVLLKTQAQATGYNYDRMWVPIQDTRPEVIAPAVGLALLLAVTAAACTASGLQGRGWGRVVLAAGRWLRAPSVLVAVVAVGAVAVAGSGLSILLRLHPEMGMGGVLAAGLKSSAFVAVVVMAAAVALSRVLLGHAARSDSLLAPIARAAHEGLGTLLAVLALLAVAAVGVGASQTAGTWSFPLYLVGCWWLVVTVVLAAAGRTGHHGGEPGRAAWMAVGMGFFAAAALAGPLAVRYIAETQPRAEAWRYLMRLLVASADAAALLLAAALVAVNRWAAPGQAGEADGSGAGPRWSVRIDAAVAWVGRIERPHWAAAAMVLAGIVFSTGYGRALLPGLSLHFSQKHLLQHVSDSAGAAVDSRGQPRAFAHGSSQSGSGNNFYTQTMPLIEDRQAVVALLAGDNVATRITDNAQGGIARTLALPGWDPQGDANHDQRRDEMADFAVVHAVEGARVQVAGAGWQAGAWQGAAVWAPSAQSATVIDNTTDTLTLSVPLTLVPDDPAKGWIAIDKASPGGGTRRAWQHAAMRAEQRFVVLPKDAFSEVNHAFRQAHGGRHIAVVDAASSRLVLAANFLQAAQVDQNWLRQALVTPEDLARDKAVQRISVNFDNTIQLVGFKLAEPAVSRSQKYKMTLYWKVLKATPTSWKLFMHPHPLHLDRWPLTDPDPSEDENKPCNGCFQTNHWQPGDLIADSFEQEVPLGTSAGPNEIILGWYNPSSDTRLPVLSATGPGVIKHGDNRATIGHLQVR